MTTASTHPPARSGWRPGPGLLALPIGGLLTVLTYAVLPSIPDPNGTITRYLAGHPLEYVIYAMFCVGLAHVGLRLMAGASLRRGVAEADQRLRTADPHFMEADTWRAASGASESGPVANRLEAYADLRDRWRGGSVVEYAQLFGERDADDVAGSYAVLQTILWAIPIVGFLGTVMGITIAIANISPEQLEGSLTSVTGGLAVAFDTTALSLALSLILGFGSLFARRSEEAALRGLDRLCEVRVLPAFPQSAASVGENEESNDPAAQMLAEHVRLWAGSLADQRRAIDETLAAGHAAFVEAVKQSRREAAAAQREAWEATTEELGETLADWQARVSETLNAAADRAAHSDAASGEVVRLLTDQGRQWGEVLDRAKSLDEVRRSLDTTLDSARVAEQLDQTVHQLTAAVHLMTSRRAA